jgi:hypothetical protein
VSWFPLRYAHQNVLVGRGDTHAGLYRVGCISYPFMATADKRAWLARLARFAYVVGADFSLWRVNRAYPAERYVEQAERMLDARHQEPAAWRSYLAGHEAHLRTLRSFVPEVYLAIALPPERPPQLGASVLAGDGSGPSAAGGGARSRRVAADRGVGSRCVDRGGGARVSPRRGTFDAASSDDARAAVVAASRRVPRPR